jgi:hypothetical protein
MENFKMPLCNSCNALDIRRLLLTFNENRGRNDMLSGRNIPSQPTSYHDSILSIRDGARYGCELCSMIWNTFVQELDTSRTGVNQNMPFAEFRDEYFAHEFSGAVLLSVEGPPKARIEVRANSRLLMTFFPFQETGAYTKIRQIMV